MDMKNYVPKVRGLINRLDTIESDHLHMAMGMTGEIGEVTDLLKKQFAYGRAVEREAVLEELGDFLFYAVGLADMLGVSLSNFDPAVVEEISTGARAEKELLAALSFTSATVFLGAATAEIWKNHTLIADAIVELLSNSERLARLLGSNLNEVMDLNIKKLSTRYPDLKFDADRANNRDVAAEKEAMSR